MPRIDMTRATTPEQGTSSDQRYSLHADALTRQCPGHDSDINRDDNADTRVTWEDSQSVVRDIYDNLVGRHTLFDSPYGDKAICYADWTASGRALHCVEDYIRENVLPHYGNTHTTTSITGSQTTAFREEARQIIAQAVNAKTSGKVAEDCVLFTGQGTTSAINKLVTALGLMLPLPEVEPPTSASASTGSTATNCSNSNSQARRPVVFVGPFEHHSNILPWRESCAEVIQVPETAEGKLDVAFLVTKLQLYADRPLKIGSFSAASNLTGILTDVDHVSAVLHMHGALAFWDYATCAPYVPIDMNPVVHGPMRPYVYKDAVFLSGHKFVGGPNSPGVLVCKKRLLGNAVPTAPGGGTVFFVTKNDHRYLSNKIEREEGGTPDIIGSIRLGLAFQLKQRVDPVHIMRLERHHLSTVRRSLESNPNIVLLGHNELDKLPIFSFLVRFGERFLHFNFVCALLNDLFGIQTRGGCQCAGPYATRILGITDDLLYAFECAMVDKQIVLRAGFSRISFPYFMADADVEYTLKALHFVADEGWKFLPQYRFDHKTGVWKHHTRFTKFSNRRWLSDFSTSKSDKQTLTGEAPQNLTEAELRQHQQFNLDQAHRLADEATRCTSFPTPHAFGEISDRHYDRLRWFVYPSEAVAAIHRQERPPCNLPIKGPVQPQKYRDNDPTLAYSTVDSMASIPSRVIAWREASSNVPQQPPPTMTDTEMVPMSIEELIMNTIADDESNGPIPTTSDVATIRREQPDRASKHPDRSSRVEDHKRPLRSAEDAPAKVYSATHFDHAHTSTSEILKKVNSSRVFPNPPKTLMKWIGLAVSHWKMIEEGDRLLVAVSGGKDSIGLLHALLYLQKRSPVKFKLACATVDPETPSYDPTPLKAYIKSLGLPHFYISENLVERAKTQLQGGSILAYTARMKRGALYTCCRTHKFNKLVLGHHLDDVAESFFMSAMHNGQLRTMRACYWNDQKDVQVIRPMVYAREHLLKEFAIDARLPVINENMPQGFEAPKERQRVKAMLSKEENLFPGTFGSLRRALYPLLSNKTAHDSADDLVVHVAVPVGSTKDDPAYPVVQVGTPEDAEMEALSASLLRKKEHRRRDKMRNAVRSLLQTIAT